MDNGIPLYFTSVRNKKQTNTTNNNNNKTVQLQNAVSQPRFSYQRIANTDPC